MSCRIGRRSARWAARRARRAVPPAPACPSCKATLDGHVPHGAARPPQPGDLTACFQCSAPLLFGEGLVLRLLTAEELAALPPEVRAQLERARCIGRPAEPAP